MPSDAPPPARKPLTGPTSGAGPKGDGSRMETALAKHGGGALAHAGRVPASILELKEKVRMAWEGGLLPAEINSIEKATVIALKGAELGLPPMQAFSSIYVVKGRPSPKTELMVALAFKRVAGFGMEVLEQGLEIARVKLWRSGSAPATFVHTKADAEREGLWGSDQYRKRPAVMLMWRALSKGLRFLAPDVMQGSYTAEELLGPAVPQEVGDAVLEGDPKRDALEAKDPTPKPPAGVVDVAFQGGGEAGGAPPGATSPEGAEGDPVPEDLEEGALASDLQKRQIAELGRALEDLVIAHGGKDPRFDVASKSVRSPKEGVARLIEARGTHVLEIGKKLKAGTAQASIARILIRTMQGLLDELGKPVEAPKPEEPKGEVMDDTTEFDRDIPF